MVTLLEELTIEEWINLHKEVITKALPKNVADEIVVDIDRKSDPSKIVADLTIPEIWGDGPVETSYEVDTINGYRWLDYVAERGTEATCRRDFRKWMLKRFGGRYLRVILSSNELFDVHFENLELISQFNQIADAIVKKMEASEC